MSVFAEPEGRPGSQTISPDLARGTARILLVRAWDPSGPILNGSDQRLATLQGALASCGQLESVAAYRSIAAGSVEEAARSAALWGALRERRARGPGMTSDLAELAAGADVVFLDSLAAYWWSGISDSRRTIIDIADVVSQTLWQGLGYGSWPKRPLKWARFVWCKRSERALLNRFRMTLVCSQNDRAYLRLPRVEVVPNSYRAHPLMDAPRAGDAERDLLFVGSMFYKPNFEGVRWFVQQVLPLIRRQKANVRFTVIGRSPDKMPRDWQWLRSPHVEFIGTVPDVAPYVRSARLEVCPLLRGSGTRIKILESLAYGTPIVSTHIGAYGLPMREAEGLIRRDRPGEFADACLRLLHLAEHRSMIGDSGRSYVRQHFSPEAIRSRLSSLVGQVLSEVR
jgi:glycosyltransferase involved in cell wall biosynthesis